MFSRPFCLLILTASMLAQSTSSAKTAHSAKTQSSSTPPPITFQCGATSESFLRKANRLVLAQLAMQPVEAGQIGLHMYRFRNLDTELDDYSEASLRQQRALIEAGQKCFATYKDLKPEDNADLEVLRDSMESALLQLDKVQAHKYQPQIYVEMIGSGLFFPLTQTTGTEQQRLEAVVARMEKVPAVLAQAKQNLVEADPVFIETAIQENDGNKGVIEMIGQKITANGISGHRDNGISKKSASSKKQDGAKSGQSSKLAERYSIASKNANAAIDDFSKWLKDDLAKRPHTRTWRTGPELYAEIFQHSLGPGTKETPQSVLARAEAELKTIREEMMKVATPAHAQWFPEHGDHSDLAGSDAQNEARENKIISEVINKINDDHTTPDHLLDQVKGDAQKIRQFILEKNLLTLSSRDNMKIVDTPAFLRGIYSVAGFHSAPPLEPGSEAQYWVTPIAPGTPKEKAESKLREYNNWMLLYLTMHEALPGHYTQFEHANDVTPEARRVFRQVLASGPYAEGWGEYAVRLMEDAGYANHDPRFVMMVLKIRLRVVINAILDIKLQSMNMPEQEALDLMEKQGFQTEAEATGKLLRAKLSSGQLITYFVGYHQWLDMRDRYQKAAGGKFDLKKFNDEALSEGTLPIPLVEAIMMQRMK
jgi:uncharacterized protein (DUF885 family)